jgi:hypothetical protein
VEGQSDGKYLNRRRFIRQTPTREKGELPLPADNLGQGYLRSLRAMIGSGWALLQGTRIRNRKFARELGDIRFRGVNSGVEQFRDFGHRAILIPALGGDAIMETKNRLFCSGQCRSMERGCA